MTIQEFNQKASVSELARIADTSGPRVINNLVEMLLKDKREPFQEYGVYLYITRV